MNIINRIIKFENTLLKGKTNKNLHKLLQMPSSQTTLFLLSVITKLSHIYQKPIFKNSLLTNTKLERKTIDLALIVRQYGGSTEIKFLVCCLQGFKFSFTMSSMQQILFVWSTHTCGRSLKQILRSQCVQTKLNLFVCIFYCKKT